MNSHRSVLPVAVFAALSACLAATAGSIPALVVATQDSSERSKTAADFLADGAGDQEEINAAIRALPEVGGTVLLAEGTFDIRRIEGRLGGVLIERSNVVLAGQGAATKLVQAPEQETNVIRIIGDGIGNITIRDLYVDANRDANPEGVGDLNVAHDRFEFCGIKAYCQRPGQSGAKAVHDVTIRNTTVVNARRLGIVLEGPNMRVVDNVLGNAFSDSVEILTGPGIIRGNYVEITGRTHVAIGTDRADNILMTDNIVHVRADGHLDIGFRSWADSQRHVIAGNVLTVDAGGQCAKAMDIRGYGAVVTGNNLYTANPESPLVLAVTAGNTIVANNILENAIIEINDTTPEQKNILVIDNILDNAVIDLRNGNLTQRGNILDSPAPVVPK